VAHICFVSGFAAGTIHDTICKLLHPRRLKMVSSYSLVFIKYMFASLLHLSTSQINYTTRLIQGH
jgi:hypothetical protein